MFGSKETVKVAPLLLFAIFDSKAGFWMPPMAFRSRGEALRSFMAVANDKSSQIGMHPGDYTLFHIGSFDEDKGILMPASVLENLGLALNFVKSEVTA